MIFRRIEKYTKNISMRKKLLWSYSLVVLIPIILIGYYFLSSIVGQSIQHARITNEVSFNQMATNVENFLTNYVQLLDLMKYDSLLTNFLQKTYTDDIELAQRYFDYFYVSTGYSERLAYQRIYGINIAVYTTNNQIYSTGSEFIFKVNESDFDSCWYTEAVNNKDQNHICDPVLLNGKYCIPITALLTPGSRFTNVLKIDIPEDLIYKMMEKESADKKVYLVNSNLNIISSTDRNSIGKRLDSIPGMHYILPQLNNTGRFFSVDNRENVYFISKIGKQGNKERFGSCWMISVVSSQPLLAQINEIMRVGLLVCLLVALLDIVLIFLFSNGITRRLNKLVKAMEKVKDGRFNIPVDCEGKDEISLLTRSLKEMLNRIETLINKVYTFQLRIKDLELKAKEAEIRSLQSQINPHFLYNTLASIKTNVIKKKDFETADIIVSFARLIRKSSDWRSDQVPLKNEIELVEDYLKIQKFRHRNKLDYKISIDECYNNIPIPKFTLQPIVENAVYHGIEPGKDAGHIIIYSEPCDKGLKIIIKDNGIGMDGDTYAQIAKNLENWSNPVNHENIGLLNVHQRLKLNYGQDYGLTIKSKPGEGTTVVICIPA